LRFSSSPQPSGFSGRRFDKNPRVERANANDNDIGVLSTAPSSAIAEGLACESAAVVVYVEIEMLGHVATLKTMATRRVIATLPHSGRF
jgi:hypothetical protein